MTERWKDRDKQKKNPDECSAFIWVHGEARAIKERRGGAEGEPGPRRTTRARLGLLQVRERVRNPDECLSRSSGLAKVVSYAKTSQTSIWELVWDQSLSNNPQTSY